MARGEARAGCLHQAAPTSHDVPGKAGASMNECSSLLEQARAFGVHAAQAAADGIGPRRIGSITRRARHGRCTGCDQGYNRSVMDAPSGPTRQALRLAVGPLRPYRQWHGPFGRHHGTVEHQTIRQDGKPKASRTARAAEPLAAGASKRPDWVNLKVAWPQPKQAISLRIDQDILSWFRDGGPGYQTRMNAVLRAFVDAQQGRR